MRLTIPHENRVSAGGTFGLVQVKCFKGEPKHMDLWAGVGPKCMDVCTGAG